MTETEKALYNYLVNYVTDETTAKLIIKGGENGYYYGRGGYVSIDRNDNERMSELTEDDEPFLIDDASLNDAYLIGSAY